MKVSLILCVRNGGPQLDLCLKHLAALAGPSDFEIILVDNNSDDGVTLNKLHAFKGSCNFNVIVTECAISGNSAGRNVALKEATGDILLFIDGDCYVESNFVLDWLAIFKSYEIGYGSGRILRFDLRYSGLGCNETEYQEIIPARKFVRRGFIQGSNMAFSRTCLEAVGPFDIRFGAGTPFAGEEWEVAMRASFLGFSGGYFPTPTVSHDHRRLDSISRERLFFYDYGAGAVYAKHLIRRNNWPVIKKFFGEIRSMRRDPSRLRYFSGGLLSYYYDRFKRHA